MDTNELGDQELLHHADLTLFMEYTLGFQNLAPMIHTKTATLQPRSLVLPDVITLTPHSGWCTHTLVQHQPDTHHNPWPNLHPNLLPFFSRLVLRHCCAHSIVARLAGNRLHPSILDDFHAVALVQRIRPSKVAI
jgi:hypothetical protein